MTWISWGGAPVSSADLGKPGGHDVLTVADDRKGLVVPSADTRHRLAEKQAQDSI
jgi:hypothetical protein